MIHLSTLQWSIGPKRCGKTIILYASIGNRSVSSAIIHIIGAVFARAGIGCSVVYVIDGNWNNCRRNQRNISCISTINSCNSWSAQEKSERIVKGSICKLRIFFRGKNIIKIEFRTRSHKIKLNDRYVSHRLATQQGQIDIVLSWGSCRLTFTS